MFRESRAFGSFAVDDIAAARTFYGETLGLDVEEVEMGGVCSRSSRPAADG